jgi:hypothetical protein
MDLKIFLCNDVTEEEANKLCAAIECFIGVSAAIIEVRPTMPAPDAVDSAASTSIVHASAESTLESES